MEKRRAGDWRALPATQVPGPNARNHSSMAQSRFSIFDSQSSCKLLFNNRFLVPMNAKKRKRSFHESVHSSNESGRTGSRSFNLVLFACLVTLLLAAGGMCQSRGA